MTERATDPAHDDERRRQAHLMRLAGVRYDEIARRLGYSSTHAAERAVARSAAASREQSAAVWQRAIDALHAQGYSMAQVVAAVREREARERRAEHAGPVPATGRYTRPTSPRPLPPLPVTRLPDLPRAPKPAVRPPQAPTPPRADPPQRLDP